MKPRMRAHSCAVLVLMLLATLAASVFPKPVAATPAGDASIGQPSPLARPGAVSGARPITASGTPQEVRGAGLPAYGERGHPVYVETANDPSAGKLQPGLLEDPYSGDIPAASPEDAIGVLVYAAAGTDLHPYLDRLLVRPYVMPNGTQAYYGYVKASRLGKLASLPEVAAVQEMRNLADLPPKVPQEVPRRIATDREARRARLSELEAASGPATTVAQAPASLERITDWFDVLDVHKSRAAWELGYTGAGVKVLVNDSGIDFSHPDLMGTVARIEDPASPYYGWPEMFDSYSMWNLASDYFNGTDYIASGVGMAGAAPDYADTRAVRSRQELLANGDGTYSARFAPIGAPAEHLYRLFATSKSGIYHFGSHPDTTLRDLSPLRGRAAVLVVDEQRAGVYDTVYVDLDGDRDFIDEKPARKGDEYIYQDLNGDGYPDLSGGIIYWISDGAHAPPVTDWLWGIGPDVAGPGDLIAFTVQDFNEAGGNHGQLCASGVTAQGVVDGGAPAWKPRGDGTPGTGMVQGGGKGARLVANGNFYVSLDTTEGYLLAALGYDGRAGTSDDVQIISNSWGYSSIDNDGWDYLSRSIDTILRYLNPALSEVNSTGNGAPGYGTVTSPGAPLAISVGASTLFDSTGSFDSIVGRDQFQYNDLISWSNRGPTAQGTNGVSVLADGAFAAGDLPLNEVLDGWNAWDTWGGTSRSAPVAAGNLALVYQGFKARHGRWPTNLEARAILMAGADRGYSDSLSEGAGVVNALRSVSIAAGLRSPGALSGRSPVGPGVYALPESWSFGDYRGRTYEAFANVMYAGEISTKIFTLNNPGTTAARLQVRDEWPVRVDRREFRFTSRSYILEEGDPNRADYLLDITGMIAPDADMVEVRAVFPLGEFDPDGNYSPNSRWRLHVLDWTDANGDGKLWEDLNANGVVSCPAGLGSPSCEIQAGEYLRFGYAYNAGTSLQQRVKQPLQRMHDGIFLALRHQVRSASVPVTHFVVRVDSYKMTDHPWLTTDAALTVPAGGSATLTASMAVPQGTGPGLYAAAIRLSVEDPATFGNGSPDDISIPVVVNVAVRGTDFLFGGLPASGSTYDNGEVSGYFDWSWRAESGDWRFYFVDVPDTTPSGTNFLVDSRWTGLASDIDTIVLGPTSDCFSNGVGCSQQDSSVPVEDDQVYGPYTLDVVGRSRTLYRGSGVWTYDTSSGGPREIVVAPARRGLNLIALHNVLYDGSKAEERFEGQVGTINGRPDAVELNVGIFDTSGSVPITVSSSLPLAALNVEAFGLSLPQAITGLPQIQDNPDFPSTASYRFPIGIRHGARLSLSTQGTAGDIDLYLLYDSNSDGTFNFNTEVVASSGTVSANEMISLDLPPDGNYLAAVHGYKAADTTFDIAIEAIQGYDMKVTDLPQGPPWAPNTPISFTVDWNRAVLPGQTIEGLVVVGLPEVPNALQIPVRLRNQASRLYLPYAGK